MSAPDVAFIGGHAADVVREAAATEVGVEVVQRRAHLARVLLIDAKDNRFRKTVAALFQKIGEMPRDGLPCVPAGRQRARSPWSRTRHRESARP